MDFESNLFVSLLGASPIFEAQVELGALQGPNFNYVFQHHLLQSLNRFQRRMFTRQVPVFHQFPRMVCRPFRH